MDKKIIIPVVISGVVVSVVIGGLVLQSGKTDKDENNSPTIVPTNTSITPTSFVISPSVSTAPIEVSYKDGTYKANGSYTSPAGKESIDVELIIKDGKIETVSITTKGMSSTSKQYQNKFKGGISDIIVGKSIKDEFKPTAVSGSSLTPIGFKDAYEQIQRQAAI